MADTTTAYRRPSRAGTKTVMVVEDERPLLEVIQLKLEGSGFDIITARSVAQAVDFLTHVGTADIIWLDHYLLGKDDGITFVRQVKQHAAWRDIPIVVVSNSSSEETRKRYIETGADRFYTKADTPLDNIVKDLYRLLNMPGPKAIR